MSDNYDRAYWGPGGIDLSRWGNECKRGLRYADTGAPVASGTKGVERKISTGRKARGSASDDYDHQNAILKALDGKKGQDPA